MSGLREDTPLSPLTVGLCLILLTLSTGPCLVSGGPIDINAGQENNNLKVEQSNLPAGGPGVNPGLGQEVNDRPKAPIVPIQNMGGVNNAVNPNAHQNLNAPRGDIGAGPAGGGGFNNQPLPGEARVGGGGTGNARPSAVKIAEHPDCSADVKSFCSKSSATNNFAVLDCLQNDLQSEQQIAPKCQHFLWTYKQNLTQDIRFDSAASEVCDIALKQFPECNKLDRGQGLVIPCLIGLRPNITNANCKQFLVKMSSIVFSDYRLVQKMTEACRNDIEKLSCGRINSNDPQNKDSPPHTQGHTVECLSEHVKDLDEQCKHEILRIAELQADDYHMDRPLYYACRDDRERFCKRTKAGSGKVFKCLYRHKFEKDMSRDCQEKLVLRQRLMQEDFKVNKGLAEHCQADIQTHHCLKGELPSFKHGRLSVILLCLEGAMRDGNTIDPECLGELKDVRQSLMEDFKISPNIVVQCADEIKDSCGQGLHREGRTLHCLMDLARPKPVKGGASPPEKISDRCQRALESLIAEADVGENYEMDAALYEACQPVAEVACHDMKAGEARVLTCLMEKVGTKEMTDDCEERLMEIQFFIARDFKLDPRLYKHCRKDATEHCSAPKNWHDPRDTTPEVGPLVFSCLYRHLKFYQTDKEKQLSRACMFEVRRVMHQRAVSVNLEPRIEGPCIADLGAICSEATEKGDEITCLQDNYDDLTYECRMAIGNYTEDTDEDPSLDRILMRSCTPMIKQFCNDLLDSQSTKPGDVMECLIRFKHHNDMNDKCAAGIEHHQLISLKDFKFTFKFKEACRKDVLEHCKGSKRKNEVIRCLSEAVRNDTLLDEDHRVNKQCRKQLRFEMMQRDESIDLDPVLKDACTADVKKLCSNIVPGSSQVIECLKKHAKELTHPCHQKIFQREKETAENPGGDYLIMTTCKRMIKRYCMDEAPGDMFRCLRKSRDEEDFDPKCKNVLRERIRQKNRDIRLNPKLEHSCERDIPKFCGEDMEKAKKSDTEVEGKVINCLRIKFAQRKLSRTCEEHIGELIKSSQMDYQQDPVLMASCKNEVKQYCLGAAINDEEASDDRGRMTECLKQKLAAGKISNPACQLQIARVLSEDRADIHVDPLLNRACALDLKHYCFDVPRGEGKQMSCLLAALDDKTVRLAADCKKMLEDRVTMWEYAAKVAPPDTIQELVAQVTTSPSRNYFLGIIMSVIGLIFIGGLFCGRVTKRVRAELKNK